LANSIPFSLTTRKNSKYFYVRFKNSFTGQYMTWRSTKETDYKAAVRKAWSIYRGEADPVGRQEYSELVQHTKCSKEDALLILEEFRRRGIIRSYVLSGADGDVRAYDFLIDFWNPEKSEYLNDKNRKGQKVHSNHLQCCTTYVRKYWADILKDKLLGELTKADIQQMFNKLDQMDLNGNSKNHILRAVLTPMKWAYAHELVKADLSLGWTFYKVEYEKRIILSRELAGQLFLEPWDNPQARLANQLAMCTGMRSGEIEALQLEDIGPDYIMVQHSWSPQDGMKCPKNGEERKVLCPFKKLLQNLRAEALSNPHGESFVFWSAIPGQPIGHRAWVKSFRAQLEKIGLSKKEAGKYTFHAWRHFYATYLSGTVDRHALQTQTGHKTEAMLDHYSDHFTPEEESAIRIAVSETFSDLIS